MNPYIRVPHSALFSSKRGMKFNNSSDYWETRYKSGGTSGAGSCGRLARFKSEVLNQFVKNNNVTMVLEFGSGDGAQLELARYPHYVGVDVSTTALGICRNRFRNDATKLFHSRATLPDDLRAELTLSLDVIYHLVEDNIFYSYMDALFDRSTRYVIVYSSNSDWAAPAQHVRHRRFTDWIDVNRPDWGLIEHVPNRYPFSSGNWSNTSFAEFFIFERK